MASFFALRDNCLPSSFSASQTDIANLLVCAPWQSLHTFSREGVFVAWTDLGRSVQWHADGNNLALLIGHPYSSADVCDLLKKILLKVEPETAGELLAPLDGRYSLLIVKNKRLYFANDVLGSVRTYFAVRGSAVAYSTELKVLQRAFGSPIDRIGMRQKLLFLTNYRSSLLQSVEFVRHDVLRIHPKDDPKEFKQTPMERLQYCSEISALTEDEAIERASSIFERAIGNSGLKRAGGCTVSLSGGRDSRFVLAELASHIPARFLRGVTFSGDHDHEGAIARWVAKSHPFVHEVMTVPDGLPKNIEQFVWSMEDFGWGALLGLSMAEMLHQTSLPIIESNSAEVFWGHIHYGKGDGPIHTNFVHNRKSSFPTIAVPGAADIARCTEREAAEICASFPKEFPWTAQVGLLDLLAFQNRWCFWVLKQHDIAGGCCSLFINREAVNFFLSLPEQYLANHYLYRLYCQRQHASWFRAPTTRSFNFSFRQLSFRSCYWFVVGKWFRKFGEYSLARSLRNGAPDLYDYIEQHQGVLAEYVDESYIPQILGSLRRIAEKPAPREFSKRLRQNFVRLPRKLANVTVRHPVKFGGSDIVMCCCAIAMTRALTGKIDHSTIPRAKAHH